MFTYQVWVLFAGGQGGAGESGVVHVATTSVGPQPLLGPMSELLAAMDLAVPRTSTDVVSQPFCVDAHRPVSRAIWVSVFWPQKMIPNWTIAPTSSISAGKAIANSTRLWPGERVAGRSCPSRRRAKYKPAP